MTPTRKRENSPSLLGRTRCMAAGFLSHSASVPRWAIRRGGGESNICLLWELTAQVLFYFLGVFFGEEKMLVSSNFYSRPRSLCLLVGISRAILPLSAHVRMPLPPLLPARLLCTLASLGHVGAK